MKRTLFGMGLLLALLVLCLAIGRSAERICLPAADWAARASEACVRGDRFRAERYLSQADSLWQENRRLVALWADHTPMEQAEVLIRQAGAFLRAGAPGEAASVCAGLSKLLRSIAEAQQLSWQNLL